MDQRQPNIGPTPRVCWEISVVIWFAVNWYQYSCHMYTQGNVVKKNKKNSRHERLYLFTFPFMYVVILYFISVPTPSDWEEAEIHMKFKGIL